jgi:predicted outer membrane repeat protein
MYLTAQSTLAAVDIVTFSRNRAGGDGGGQLARDATLEFATFSRNRAGGHGDGVYSYGNLIVRNVTFSGNRAKQGGGLAVNSEAASSSTLTNVTVEGNRATLLDGSPASCPSEDQRHVARPRDGDLGGIPTL